ncbi:secretin N-terminal domain-containing protein [Thermodesulfobacteriota bacterium]
MIKAGKKGEAEKKEEKELEYVTEVVRLSYAKAEELKGAIEGSIPADSTVTFDNRTNSLLIKAEKVNIDKIIDIISQLDSVTKQIMIKAEIVEATEGFSKELGIQWGGDYSYGRKYGNSPGNNFPNSYDFTGSSGTNSYAVNLPSENATAGIGINFGSLTKAINLDLRLSAMEKNGKIHVVSKPRIATLNNMPAKIHSGITFRVRTSTEVTSGNSSTTESELDEIKAGIDLVVTPRISHDNLIELKIDVTKSEPDFSAAVDGIPGIIDKNANTTVLVKNGETTIIGGLNKDAKNDLIQSVPFFAKIPIIGWFFRNKTNVDSKENLLILITPILIENSNFSKVNGK